MDESQRIVAMGAASGVALMALSVYGLMQVIPAAAVADAMGERLAYALAANVFALIPLFIMLVTIGNSRFLSDAIDPTKHAESRDMEVDGRVADNTLQQNFVFFVATLGLSTVVPMEYLHAVWALAFVYVAARYVFWLGYRLNPLFRAPGMAATAYMNLGIILYMLYMALPFFN